ncbi:MAG TPA: exodeoxyribonuclease VII large subunit [Phenylobacterium sp.]|jgi:exodeoxyribonuclease VII large subunit|uniref:exodeoxyribonuclease VII large subunit n=1 Tax=Phenylobacterium sp. TaxID=1871053 RepID=UPI002CB25E4E|nr:exodeoxyribonuclease VII large subunit [Phenylobacterium sp.]HXA40824.1 exodeoxyribonuclease VII large subunit [Phenylobacterium sp.]
MTDVAPDPSAAPTEGGNAKPYSVSELAFALKRTLEDAYGFVRLRGEISKVTHHANGHVYLTLKDERAAIDGVVWKGQVRGLGIRPEQGLEVIVTGKITSYPAGSRYQIVIETMEAAGVGALLAQLERLKAKLAAEGLFAVERKQALPSMPAVVGVITSPTGAVIRDILHRIRDRWPCRVIVWPVVVQGDQAAAQVGAAIRGFEALDEDGPIPRPDVLIVARGGGSVEDLWPFNDEALARAVAACTIPLISAVGHETDTTLIDFVSDRRAPTPTAAAEIATPVLAELKALVGDLGARMHRCGGRAVEDRRGRVQAAGRALTRVGDLVELAAQRFGIVSGRLAAGLAKNAAAHERDLVRVASRLSPLLLQRPQAVQRQRLDGAAARLHPGVMRGLERAGERLDALSKLYVSVDPDRPLQRGFARVTRADGSIVHAGAILAGGEEVAIKFGDLVTRQAVIEGAAAEPAAAKPLRPRPKAAGAAQGELF